MATCNSLKAFTLTGIMTGLVTLPFVVQSLTDNQTATFLRRSNPPMTQGHTVPGLGGVPSYEPQDQRMEPTRPHVIDQVSVPSQPPLHTKPTVATPLMGFCHPLKGLGYKSQGNNGTTHQGRGRYAYDLATQMGTPVYAMRSGRVVGFQDRYPDIGGGRERALKFNYISLQHEGDYRSAYVHLQQNFQRTVGLNIGDWVNAGDLIGYSGNSGWSSGPHLHIEVQSPSQSPQRFSQTVPFAIKGYCASS